MKNPRSLSSDFLSYGNEKYFFFVFCAFVSGLKLFGNRRKASFLLFVNLFGYFLTQRLLSKTLPVRVFPV